MRKRGRVGWNPANGATGLLAVDGRAPGRMRFVAVDDPIDQLRRIFINETGLHILRISRIRIVPRPLNVHVVDPCDRIGDRL